MLLSGLPLAVVEAGLTVLRARGATADMLEGWDGTGTELLAELAPAFAASIAVWRELQQRAAECTRRGQHSWEVVEDPDSATPLAVACAECGTSFEVLQTLLPETDVPVATGNGSAVASRKAQIPRRSEPDAAATPDEPPEPEPELEVPSPAGNGSATIVIATSDAPADLPDGAVACDVCANAVDERTLDACRRLPFTRCDHCLFTCSACGKRITAKTGDPDDPHAAGDRNMLMTGYARWGKPTCRACHADLIKSGVADA